MIVQISVTAEPDIPFWERGSIDSSYHLITVEKPTGGVEVF